MVVVTPRDMTASESSTAYSGGRKAGASGVVVRERWRIGMMGSWVGIDVIVSRGWRGKH